MQCAEARKRKEEALAVQAIAAPQQDPFIGVWFL